MLQDPGVFRTAIVFDFGPGGCIGRRLEAVFDIDNPDMPVAAPTLPYQPRHRALPSRVDAQIVRGVKPERSSAAFARPPRPHPVPDQLRALFDAKDEGALRAELSRPVVDLRSFADKVGVG